MTNPERIWDASLEQLKLGYAENEEHFTCLCCGKQFEKGIIYPEDGVLYEAERYARLHIEKEHQSVFGYLVGLDKRMTGLSQLQQRLLLLFYEGKTDAEVQKEVGIGSTSTIRNHRFILREKERQAKVFLAIMELLRERDKHPSNDSGPLKRGGKDKHRQRTDDSYDQVIQEYFPYGVDGPIKSLSIQEKHQPVIFDEIATRFQRDRRYTEAEVNQVLATVFEDYAALRRYLVDVGLLGRLQDGSQYWLDVPLKGEKERTVDRKKELKRLAKETRIDAGVFRITNTSNGKVFVESTRDLKTMNGQRFQLELGSHPNKKLQQEWDAFGADAFQFEVLEVLEKPDTGYFDERDALNKLKGKWLDRLQPFEERGYNRIGESK